MKIFFLKSDLLWLVGCFLMLGLTLDSCIHEPFIDPLELNNGQPAVPGCVPSTTVCFESSVLPIFISSCAKSGCHDAVSHEDGYTLDSYNNIIRKGIVPGNASESKIYDVLFESGEDLMPPDGPLSQTQTDLIKNWINQGAKNTVDCDCNCDPTKFSFSGTIQPMLNVNCVGCHKPGSLGGNVDLSTYNAVKAAAVNGTLLGSVTHATGYVPMPQGGNKLSDCQITQISNWISAGTPNN